MCNKPFSRSQQTKHDEALAEMETVAFEMGQEKVAELLGQWITPTLVTMVENLVQTSQTEVMLQSGTDLLTVRDFRRMAVAAIMDNLHTWVEMTRDQPINELF